VSLALEVQVAVVATGKVIREACQGLLAHLEELAETAAAAAAVGGGAEAAVGVAGAGAGAGAAAGGGEGTPTLAAGAGAAAGEAAGVAGAGGECGEATAAAAVAVGGGGVGVLSFKEVVRQAASREGVISWLVPPLLQGSSGSSKEREDSLINWI
jgi:hypothetical protein